jgi:hypothetical protein
MASADHLATRGQVPPPRRDDPLGQIRHMTNLGQPSIGTGCQAMLDAGADLIHDTPHFGSQHRNGSRQSCVQSLICVSFC